MIRGTPIDFALALIEAIRGPHETFNTRQIAAVVNMLVEEGFGSGVCRHQDIYFLELRAMKKVGLALIRRGLMDAEKSERLYEVLHGDRYAHVGGVQRARKRKRKREQANEMGEGTIGDRSQFNIQHSTSADGGGAR